MKSIDHGIFLNRKSYSETSLITTFYTKKSGLQNFFFRGGKKKSHNMFPMSISELSFYGRTDSGLKKLTQVDSFSSLSFQFNPIKSAIAFFMAEAIQKSVYEGDVDEKIFDFILSYVKELDSTDDLKLFPISFLIGFSDVLGFKPLIQEKDVVFFNLDSGIFQSSINKMDRVKKGLGVQLILCLLNEQSPIDFSKESRDDALDIMLEYFMIHISKFKELESHDIIRQVLYE
ncbi:MAG: DNA repair protein RecO [Crocinitomicaceae bacterium]|nr:DNA repair protein RecO [Crocinitomicaceae bacterium]|tara:strand:+ start:4867 stop:5559 length:693 start_codon:yes stop_codon:yes gene_type:complete